MPASGLCVDCHEKDGILDIRRRFLCHECFAKYVNSKVLKRADFTRVKPNNESNGRPKLLLPVSGGAASLVVLHILNQQLERQKTNPRLTTYYDLLWMHIQLPNTKTDDEMAKWRDAIITQYPSVQLATVVDLDAIFQIDTNLEIDMQKLGLKRVNGEDDTAFMQQIASKIKTATAQADLQDILMRRLVLAVAKKYDCTGIVWGHSDSRLAAKVLADVAKGRGGSVSSQIADGTAINGIGFHYPVRELFSAELEFYLKSISDDGVRDCLLQSDENVGIPPSVRQTSIDQLLSNYINTQGVKYPNVMANVVRTAGRLQISSTTETKCSFCFAPFPQADSSVSLCYGCERMRQDIRKG